MADIIALRNFDSFPDAGNFLSAMRDAQASRHADDYAARQKVVQGREDVLFDQGQKQQQVQEASQKIDRVGALLAGVKDEASLQQAKQMYVQSGLGSEQDVANVTLQDVPRLVQLSSQAQEQIKSQLGMELTRTQIGAGKANTAQSYAAADASRASAEKDRYAITPQIGPDGKPLPAPPNDKQIDNEAKVRGEFTNQSKDFVQVRDAFGRIVASAKDPSAAGDLSLIFNYMKVLDPGSTVREGEFATAQNATGAGERIINMYNNVLKGERLNPTQRSDFVNRAGKLYDRQLDSFKKTKTVYERIAKSYGFDPSRVTPDLSLGITSEIPGAPKQIASPQEYQALPPGTQYIAPDGSVRTKQ